MTYIEINDVRTAGGFPDSLISNAEIEHAIEVVQQYAERIMNTTFVPVQRVEFHDGTNKNFFYPLKNPVLRVDYLQANDTSIDIEDIDIDRESGRVTLKNTAGTSTFYGLPKSIRVKYWTGFLISDYTSTDLSASVTAGTSVTATVSDATGLAVDDWLQFQDFVNGEYTSGKITAVSGSDLTIDNLTIDMPSGSIVTKLILSESLKRFIELEAVVYLSLNAIGATYTFNASYNVSNLNVVKGVPYTHWRESYDKAVKERNALRGIIKQRFSIQ